MESFARLVIIGFIAPLDPNAQELNEIKNDCLRRRDECHYSWL